jgi:hypothetical protein
MVESSGANAIVAEALPRETAMPPQTIEHRVEKLEEQMTTLQQLPARVDALSVQISQTREDMGARFSAAEKALIATEERILTRVRVLHEDVISRLALIQEGRPRRRRSPGGGRQKG